MDISGLVKKTKDFMVPRRLRWLLGLGALAAGFLVTETACSKNDDPTITPEDWKTPGKTFSNYDKRIWLSASNTYLAAEKTNGAAIDFQYSPTATGTPVVVASDGFENRFVAFTGNEKYVVFEKRDSSDTFRTLYVWDIVNSQLFQATPTSGRFEFKDFDDLATEFCYRNMDTGQKFVHKLGTTFTQNKEFTGSEIQEYAYDKNNLGDFLIILSRDMGGGKHDLLFKDPQDNSETNVTETSTLDEIFIFEFRKLTGNGQPLDQGTWLILQEVTPGGNYKVLEYNPRDKEIIRTFADGTLDCSIPNDPEGYPLVSYNERFVVIHQDHGGGVQHVYLYDRHENELHAITTRIPVGLFNFYEANLIADSGNIIIRRDETFSGLNNSNLFWYWFLSDHLTMATNDPNINNYPVAISVNGENFAFVSEEPVTGANKKLIATSNSQILDKMTVSEKFATGPTGGIPFGARFIDYDGEQLLVFSEEEAPGGDVEVKKYNHATKAAPVNVTGDSTMKDFAFQRSGDKRRIIIKSQGATEKMKVFDGSTVSDSD